MKIDPSKEYNYSGGYVTIVGDVKGHPDLVVVQEGSDHGYMQVARKDELVPKEESWSYKKAQERAAELEQITVKAQEHFEVICEKIIKAACSTLKTRMKMNILFGAGGGGWAVAVADELDKLVSEKAKEVIEKELK